MIALWLALTAQAADVARYPVAAPIELPATGAARIDVPPELRTGSDDLLLVDANGREVPVAMLTTLPSWVADDLPPAAIAPTADPDTWTVDVGGWPVDGIRVRPPDGPFAATVTVRDADGVVIGGPDLVWRLAHTERLDLPIRPTSGALRVTWDRHGNPGWQVPELAVLRLSDPGVTPRVLRLPVASAQVQENGWVRHLVPLPAPMPISAVRLDPADPIFARQVSVQWTTEEVVPGLLAAEDWPRDPWTVQRVRLGDVAVEDVTVPIVGAGDQLVVLVDATGKPPLQLREVELTIPGLQLVALDPGPGPHTLYGGAPPGTSPRWDLQAAAPELARKARGVVAPGEVTPNPAWVAPEVRANLIAPSTPTDLDGFGWCREVQGSGLVRIGLDDDVLARARADLADLRLVTADGQQVPYLLRRRGGEQAWADLPWNRRERDGTSVIDVTLPWADVPVSSVHVTTSAPLFDRTVTVARPSAGTLQPLRAVRWVGADRPTALGIDVEQRVGDTLVLTIDNGDDPPLPIDALEVRWPAWELIAALPDQPVALYYGDPRRSAPSYDLALLRDELRYRASAVATLGTPEAVTAAPLSVLDRVLVAFGVAVLAAGLLGLLLALLRATPEQAAPEQAAPET